MPTLADLEELANASAPIVGSIANMSGASNAVGDITNQAKQATQTVQGTAANLGQTQADVLSQQKELMSPYATAGAGAVNTLSTDPSVTAPFQYSASDMVNDPGYAFRVSEGNKGINTAAAARGLWDSGGTLKALDKYNVDQANQYYNQDYTRSENTFRANQASRLNLLKDLANQGQSAAQSQSSATQNYGNQQTQTGEWTASELTQIQGAIAEAEAAGDVSKANALGSLINGAAKVAPVVGKVVGLIKPALSTAASLGTSAGLSTGAGAVPGLGSMAGTAAGLPALAPAAPAVAAPAVAPEAGAGAFGSIGSAIQSAASGAINGLQAVGSFMLSNPVTIVAGVAALAITAVLKSQAHWEANTLVKDVQNPFGQNLGKIVNNFDQALASGQLDKATAQQMRDSTTAMIDQFNNAVYDFAQKGGDNKEAALNAMRTMAEDFGARADYPNLPSYDKILGKMDQEIAQLPEAA